MLRNSVAGSCQHSEFHRPIQWLDTPVEHWNVVEAGTLALIWLMELAQKHGDRPQHSSALQEECEVVFRGFKTKAEFLFSLADCGQEF